jgi:uncharacterized protein (TIRG00374 family)
MRKILVILVFFLAMAIIMLSFSELKDIADTLERHDLRFLFLGIMIELAWMLNDAAEYRALLRVMGIEEKISRLFMLATASTFINIVAPSGGMSGIAVFLDNAAKRDHPRGRVVATGALYFFLDYIAFLCVLSLGIVVLIRRNDLQTGEITASALMVLLAIGLGTLIYLGSRSAANLGNVLAWLARQINRVVRLLTRRNWLSEDRAHEFACEMAQGLSVLHGDARGLTRPMLHALNNKMLMIGVLMMAFLDFRVPYSLGTLIAGFSIAYLFLIISPTPSGIGIVEGILPLALNSLSVAWEDAVVVTLAYRAVTFWLPLGVGGLSFRLLQRQV